MHPPGKRSMDISDWQFYTETRGRTQRSAPTRRIVSMRGMTKAEPSIKRKFHNIRRDRHTRDASTQQAQHGHQRLAVLHRNARADAAVLPYAEDCFNERHDQSRTKHQTEFP